MKVLHLVDTEINNKAYKEAYVMKKRGIQQEVICVGEGDPSFMYIFDEVTSCFLGQYPDKIVESDADVIIVHDRPNTMAPIIEKIRKYRDTRPVVYECYDLWYNLGKDYGIHNENEYYMLATSDLVAHVGYLNRNASHEAYNYSNNEIYLDSKTPRDWIPKKSSEKIGTIVYEGGAAFHNEKYRPKTMEFRDLYDVYWGFRKHGYITDIYAANEKLLDYPTICGLRYFDLLAKLTEYEWGFLGSTQDYNPVLAVAAPCKVWEYSMAGLPIIAMNMDDVVDQTNKGGIIKCHSVDEAVEIMHSVDREALAKESFETCRYLDDEIDILIDACKKLIKE